MMAASPDVIVSVWSDHSAIGVAAYDDAKEVHCFQFSHRSSSNAGQPPSADGVRPNNSLCMLFSELATRGEVKCLMSTKAAPELRASASTMNIEVELVQDTEFAPKKAAQQLGYMWPDRTELEWCTRLESKLVTARGALSAMLSHLQRAGHPVLDVAYQSLDPLLRCDIGTLQALRIFVDEQHPAACYGIGRGKEGHSVFGIADRTSSSMGRDHLRQMFLLPTSSAKELSERQRILRTLAAPCNIEIAADLSKQLRLIRRPMQLMNKISGETQQLSDYDSLMKCASAYLTIVRQLSRLETVSDRLGQIVARCHEPSIVRIVELISDTVNFAVEDVGASRVAIKEGVSNELDEIREAFDNMDNYLTRIAHQEAATLGDGFTEAVQCMFMAQFGYLVVMGAERCRRIAIPSTWEEHISTGAQVFFKTPAMRALDNDVGDLHTAIISMQTELRRAMDAELLELSPALACVVDCAELDAFLALAATAREENWCEPTFSDEPGLVLRGAFHPLLSRTTSSVATFDIELGHDGEQRVCLLTGPNGSGKSVLMHTVGIIVFLAHIGSWVPAAAAQVSPCDAIFINRVSESAPASVDHPEIQSTFGAELATVGSMLRATPKSLILMDEFGRGTLAADGIALFAATISHLQRRKEQSPLAFLVSHYTEVVTHNLVDRQMLRWFHMRCILQDDDTVSFLFQPEQGEASKIRSLALSCATTAGLPPPLVQLASKIARDLGSSELTTWTQLRAMLEDVDIISLNDRELFELRKAIIRAVP